MSEFSHGDRVRVQFRNADGSWTRGWLGTYLTAENRGCGVAHRVHRDSDGEHVHVHRDRDVRITRLD